MGGLEIPEYLWRKEMEAEKWNRAVAMGQLNVYALQAATAGYWQEPFGVAKLMRTCRALKWIMTMRLLRGLRAGLPEELSVRLTDFQLLHLAAAPTVGRTLPLAPGDFA